MSFLENAKKRYSVRDFQSKKVEKEKIDRILEAARVAPTGANLQPYSLIVVKEVDGLKSIEKATSTYNAPMAFIVCGEKSKAWVRPFDGRSIMDIDVAIVTDHMMHQATDDGLGSLWCCYFKPDIIRSEFNIPDNLEPINILLVGYANGKAQSPQRHSQTRRSLNEFVFYEKM